VSLEKENTPLWLTKSSSIRTKMSLNIIILMKHCHSRAGVILEIVAQTFSTATSSAVVDLNASFKLLCGHLSTHFHTTISLTHRVQTLSPVKLWFRHYNNFYEWKVYTSILHRLTYHNSSKNSAPPIFQHPCAKTEENFIFLLHCYVLQPSLGSGIATHDSDYPTSLPRQRSEGSYRGVCCVVTRGKG